MKAPEQFWEEIFEMTRTPGWANFTAEAAKLESGLTVESCDSLEKLCFMKGQKDILRLISILPNHARKVLAEIEAQKTLAEDPEVE